MNIYEEIKLLNIERNCIRHADVCNRECDKCELVQDTDELLEMYDAVVKNLEKLKEYENLEEQGMLIKLPIEDKKGDCRECVHTKTQCHHMEYKCSECPLTELFCDEFYLAIDRCYEDAYASGCLAGMDLAKSEAEAKLKELRGDINGR